MHIGALLVFDGDPPGKAEFVEHIESRLHLVPRYRQRIVAPPLGFARAVWIDDPAFSVDYHVVHTALPAPGSNEQLKTLVGRVMSQKLDRTKPLWEMWLVEGLERGRFAIVSKVHHALVDGVAGVDLSTVLFDLTPDPGPVEGSRGTWEPHSEPSGRELLGDAVREYGGRSKSLLGSAGRAFGDPRKAAHRVGDAALGIGEVVKAAVDAAPKTPINRKVGPHRRFDWVGGRLDDFKTVKDAFGGTVNDVVLTVAAGGLGRFLRRRGFDVGTLELRAMVPVSVRSGDDRAVSGNRITAMGCALPVYETDPVERLRLVQKSMVHVTESKRAVGAQAIAALHEFSPPTLLAEASRLNFSPRLVNLSIANVPGPQFPVYLLGHELSEVYPVGFLPAEHALFVAVVSYNGELNFGLLADYDSVDDIDVLAMAIEDEIVDLRRAAKAEGEKTRAAKEMGR